MNDRVGDADNFRLYHLPLGMRNSLVPTSKSGKHTLSWYTVY